MKRFKQFVIRNSTLLIVLMILVMPVVSWAAVDPSSTTGLVPCTEGKACDFNALLTLVNNVIDFILKFMVIPIAAIMFFYAGFELVTSGGSTEKRGIAKKVFTNAVIGLILAVAATVIVKMILIISGYTGSSLLF